MTEKYDVENNDVLKSIYYGVYINIIDRMQLASGLGRVQRDRRFEFNQHGGSREKKEDEKEDHVYVQARRKGYAVGVRSPEKGLSSSKGSVPGLC